MMLLKKLIAQLSIRNRLILSSVLWLTLLFIISTLYLPSLLGQFLETETKEQLSGYMDEIAANLSVDEAGKLSSINLSNPRFQTPYSGLYWSASTPNSLIRSRSLWDKTMQYSAKTHAFLGAKNERLITVVRNLYLPDYNEPIQVVIGVDTTRMDKTLKSVQHHLWIMLGLLFGGIFTMVLMQISWSINPLRKLKQELTELEAGRKTKIEAKYPKEINALVVGLNDLLFHYQELLNRARHHAGNLSHAVKTPLSILRNEVDLLDEKTKHQFLEPIDKIQDHINYHLSRARIAGAANILSVRSNPYDRVVEISNAFGKLYNQRDIHLLNQLGKKLNVAVEQTDLDEMLGNLLENSYKWANSKIQISAELKSADSENNNVHIMIEDDGVGIPEDQYPKVMQRGIRLDESTQGSGLGLNIVSEMAYSYRGELSLSRSQLGGLKAILTLPKARS